MRLIEKPNILCYDIHEVIRVNLMIDDKYAAMPWDEIDTVVFDVGNVLLLWNYNELLTRILPDHTELYDELTVRVFKSPYWVMRDRGSASVDEVVAAMSKTAPELEPYIRKILTEWVDIPVIPEGVEVLRACKAHGKKLYALTNYADKEFAYACEKHDFFSLFDGLFVSGREHTIKPGLEIYARMQQRFGFDPARTLFIDDSPMNIEAALESGWQGLCFNREGKLRNFFAK